MNSGSGGGVLSPESLYKALMMATASGTISNRMPSPHLLLIRSI